MNGYIKLAIAAALLAAGAAGGFALASNHYEAQLAKAQADGKQLELDNAQYKLAISQESERVQSARDKAASEAKTFWERKFAAHDEQLAEDRKNEIATRDRTIAALRSGAHSLYVSATCPSAAGSASSGGSELPGIAASAGGGDGTARVKLSVEASEFLVSLMAEADSLADQLRSAQQILLDERKFPRPASQSPAT